MSERKRRIQNVPPPSSQDAERRMRSQPQRNTKPEIAIQQMLNNLGLEYAVEKSLLPGVRRRSDIVFDAERIAIFVDGCFWHGCPIHGTWPKANADFWREKIEANQRRDADTDRRLREAGWEVVRIWEHEEPTSALTRIVSALRARKGPLDVS